MKGMLVAATAIGVLVSASPADAIPAFARKYGVSCNLCHAPAPRLNAFGETFGSNGFQMTKAEEPRDTIDTGDPELLLLRNIPLALRIDLYATAALPDRDAEPGVDLQTPWNIKLLSGGPIARNISYYLYFFLGERGAVAGLEDAYVQFTDVAASGVNLIVGQFQLSDPLFKRELRLEYDDYHLYRVRVGDVGADLTYDRGVMAMFSPWSGGDVTVAVVNGSGISEAGSTRRFDTDAFKNFAFRLSQDVAGARVGAFAYAGRQSFGSENNRTLIWGPDATLSAGNVEFNLQYLHREDSQPFAGGDAESEVDSWLGEVIFSPGGPAGKWHFAGLYNLIDADAPVLNVRLGEAAPLSRYHTVSGGAHYLLRRNVRMSGEAGYDIENERTRLTLGFFFGL